MLNIANIVFQMTKRPRSSYLEGGEGKGRIDLFKEMFYFIWINEV